jgi:hypothetical protein
LVQRSWLAAAAVSTFLASFSGALWVVLEVAAAFFAALLAGLGREFRVLREASLFIGNALPPLLAISRCLSSSMEAKPRFELSWFWSCLFWSWF